MRLYEDPLQGSGFRVPALGRRKRLYEDSLQGSRRVL